MSQSDETLNGIDDVLEDWERSGDAMRWTSEHADAVEGDDSRSVRHYGVGDPRYGEAIRAAAESMDWYRDELERLGEYFGVPPEFITAGRHPQHASIDVSEQFWATSRFEDMVADVANRIPDNQTIRGKEDAVRQVLKAALDSGWRAPEQAGDTGMST